MEIEQIEDWKGQSVIDSDGEKIGKLEDVYFETGSREPAFASVKTGMLGRRHVLVPLAGAGLSRAHVRVAYQHDLVKRAPQVDPGAELESGTRQELAGHYEIDLGAAGERGYESATARAQREVRAREATARAEELEALAERKATEAREGEQQADDTRQRAQQAQDERDEAMRAAAKARAEAREGAAPGEPAAHEGAVPGEPAAREGAVPGEPAAHEDVVPGEPAAREGAVPGEPAAREGAVPGEPAAHEGAVPGEPAARKDAGHSESAPVRPIDAD